MGVTYVFSHPVPENKSGQFIVDQLQKRLENLGAVRNGTFAVDCETFQSLSGVPGGPDTPRSIHIIHNSEQPQTCFSLLESGICLTSDLGFDQFMNSLKTYYACRKNLRVEVKGPRLELEDFVIKIGSVVLGQNMSLKGILVEVEYGPCSVFGDSWSLLREFIQTFVTFPTPDQAAVTNVKMDTLYTAKDTAMQYFEHFNGLRKSAALQPPSQPVAGKA